MKMKLVAVLVTGLSMLGLTEMAGATTLTFDDIPEGSIQSSYGNMPIYQGFTFSSTLDWIDLNCSNWSLGAHSGDFGILNNNGGVGTITEATGADFTFDGLWAKQWATLDSEITSISGILSGYNNGNLVWSVTTFLNGTYAYYDSQAGMIDELRLGFGNYFIVDDIALNEIAPVLDIALNESAPVPEPATMLLFGSGLAGLAGMARRRIRTNAQL